MPVLQKLQESCWPPVLGHVRRWLAELSWHAGAPQPYQAGGVQTHTAKNIVGPVFLCWVWSGQTREGKVLGGSSHGCQGRTAQAASKLQFLGTKKSKHVCIHLYSQGALGNSLYPTTAFPKAGVCCWMAWGQCCSQGVQPRDCRRAAGGLCLTTLLPIQQLLPCPNQRHVATEISPQEPGCFLQH